MEKFNILDQGYCPFRIEKRNWQAGCVLRLGETALCYTQDVRPLLKRNEVPNEYYCPLIKCSIDNDTYQEIKQVLAPLLQIQDEQNTAINIWPMLKGWAEPKHEVSTETGREIVRKSSQIKATLEEILFDLS
ncbi:MAG: hypothetical protein ACW97P_00360 [Candidatus Hodarchaeales archaeon]|jgi:hypothetical protein